MDSSYIMNPNKNVSRQLSSRNSDLSQTSSTANGECQEGKSRLPPSKVHVGLAKSPDLKNCKSKVESLHNIKHSPAGGNVVIQTQKLNWNAKSKVGSFENRGHKPAGGNVKVESKKLEWKTSSKVQSLANIDHKPGGGNVKIFNETYRDKSMLPSGLKKIDGQRDVKEDAAGESKATTSGAKRPAATVVARGTRPKDAVNNLAGELKQMNLMKKN